MYLLESSTAVATLNKRIQALEWLCLSHTHTLSLSLSKNLLVKNKPKDKILFEKVRVFVCVDGK